MEKDDKGSTLIRIGVSGESSFWYRPTRVVPDQRPLNGRCRKDLIQRTAINYISRLEYSFAECIQFCVSVHVVHLSICVLCIHFLVFCCYFMYACFFLICATDWRNIS